MRTFNGTNYLFATSITAPAATYTIACKVLVTSAAASRSIFAIADNSRSDTFVRLWCNLSDGVARATTRDASVAVQSISAVNIADGAWHSIALVVEADGVTLGVDGTFQAKDTGTVDLSGMDTLSIGTLLYNSSTSLAPLPNGSGVTEAAIIGRAMTSQEFADYHTAGQTVAAIFGADLDNSWADFEALTDSVGAYDLTATATAPAYSADPPPIAMEQIDTFVVAGQSNAQGQGTNQQAYTGTPKGWLYNSSSSSWIDLADPVNPNFAPNGSPWPLLASAIAGQTGRPVAIIGCADSGTALVGGPWADGGASYNTMVSRVTAAAPPTVHGVLFFQGEADEQAGASQIDYNAALDTLAAAVADDLPGAPPLVVGQIGTRSGSTGATLDPIRLAQSEAWSDNASVLAGPATHDIDLTDGGGDGIHFATDAELTTLASRWWSAIKRSILGLTGDARGPRFAAATHNPAKTRIDVTLVGPAIQAASYTASAWAVEDDGVAATISTVEYGYTNRVRIMLASAASGTLTVSFGSGNAAAGATVPLDSDSRPLEPFVKQSVAQIATTIKTQSSDGSLSAGKLRSPRNV